MRCCWVLLESLGEKNIIVLLLSCGEVQHSHNDTCFLQISSQWVVSKIELYEMEQLVFKKPTKVLFVVRTDGMQQSGQLRDQSSGALPQVPPQPSVTWNPSLEVVSQEIPALRIQFQGFSAGTKKGVLQKWKKKAALRQGQAESLCIYHAETGMVWSWTREWPSNFLFFPECKFRNSVLCCTKVIQQCQRLRK